MVALGRGDRLESDGVDRAREQHAIDAGAPCCFEHRVRSVDVDPQQVGPRPFRRQAREVHQAGCPVEHLFHPVGVLDRHVVPGDVVAGLEFGRTRVHETQHPARAPEERDDLASDPP